MSDRKRDQPPSGSDGKIKKKTKEPPEEKKKDEDDDDFFNTESPRKEDRESREPSRSVGKDYKKSAKTESEPKDLGDEYGEENLEYKTERPKKPPDIYGDGDSEIRSPERRRVGNPEIDDSLNELERLAQIKRQALRILPLCHKGDWPAVDHAINYLWREAKPKNPEDPSAPLHGIADEVSIFTP